MEEFIWIGLMESDIRKVNKSRFKITICYILILNQNIYLKITEI